jgi:hypothetical protein
MITAEYKIIEHDKYIGGYFLTPKDLEKLVDDFRNDHWDNNDPDDIPDELWIKEWLKNHDHIEK